MVAVEQRLRVVRRLAVAQGQEGHRARDRASPMHPCVNGDPLAQNMGIERGTQRQQRGRETEQDEERYASALCDVIRRRALACIGLVAGHSDT